MAHLKKVKGRYYLVAEDGKSLGPCGPRRAVALRILAVYEDRRRLRKFGILDPKTPTWTLEVLRKHDEAEAEARGLRMKPRRVCWKSILSTFGDISLSSFSHGIVETATALARLTQQNQTINGARNVLRYALKRAKALGEFDGNPSELLPPLKVFTRRAPRPLTEAEQARLLGELLRLDKRMAAEVAVLLATGSRKSERGEPEGEALRYPGHKGGNPRSFRLEGQLGALAALPRHWNYRAWYKAKVAARLPEIRPHDLRTTAATNAYLRGATVAEVQRMLGHKTPAMATRLYIQLFPGDSKAVSVPFPSVHDSGGLPGPSAKV